MLGASLHNPGYERYAGWSMKLNELLTVFRAVAPEGLAEDWDQVGVHLAGDGKPIKKALMCIDLTPAVLDEAIAHKCQLIVAYHPPIFHPLKRLADRDWKETMLAKAVRQGIAVYSPHTALDAVRPGMNDWLCDGLGAHHDRYSLGAPDWPQSDRFKVVVYVPRAYANKVRKAMGDAGAGSIGRYSECSFNIEGIGTFKGREGTHPFIGEPGKLESVEEVRIEMICTSLWLGLVIKAIRETHPYEEPAIDVLDLVSEPEPLGAIQTPGRLHHLKKPITAETLILRVKRVLGINKVKAAVPPKYGDQPDEANLVDAIAVCVGAGGKLFESCPHADAYITGEMQHHQVLDLYQRGKVVILAGHTNTERPFLPIYRERIIEQGGGKIDWLISEADKAPMSIV